MTPEQRKLFAAANIFAGLQLLNVARPVLQELDSADAQRALSAMVTLRQIAQKHRPAGLKIRDE